MTPEEIKALQEKLNKYFSLTGRETSIEVNGLFDEKTKAACKQFKSEAFVDGKISAGYLKDSGIDLVALSIDSKNFDRNNPPLAAVKAINQKLGLPLETAYDSQQFQDAVKADKRLHWVDDKMSPSVMQVLDKTVDALEKARNSVDKSLQKSLPAKDESIDSKPVSAPAQQGGRQR